jgi:hypothetical protein
MSEWWDKHMAPQLEKPGTKSSDFGAIMPLVKAEATKPPPTGALLGIGMVIGGLLVLGGYKLLTEIDKEHKELAPGRSRYF